jgi:hypothetical protein
MLTLSQDQNTTTVLNVLAALKEKDLDAAVNGLDMDQQDILMKYPFLLLLDD